MKLHRIKIIEEGDLSTARLFDLGLSIARCKYLGVWPSLYTVNDYLNHGLDDGEQGTTIQWEPCELTSEEYEQAIKVCMKGESYVIDADEMSWNAWCNKIQEPV